MSHDPAPRAVIPLAGRGPLAWEHLHGRPLWRHALAATVTVAARTLVVVEPGELERVQQDRPVDDVEVVTTEQWARAARTGDGPLLVHDPLCPLVPPEVLTDFARRTATDDAAGATSYVAFRPVTDTVKTAVDGRIVGTIDRERLAAITSPALVAAGAVPRLSVEALCDPQLLLRHLRAAGPTELVVVPSIARRVDDVSAVHLLECVDELERRLRHLAT